MKECPFCNKEYDNIFLKPSVLEKVENFYDPDRKIDRSLKMYYGHCNACEARGPIAMNPEIAKDLWNTREVR